MPSTGMAYPVKSVPRGCAVIITNIVFFNCTASRRDGAEKDTESLTTLFKHLGYEVEAHENKSQKEIQELINKLKNKDHSSYDAFILCVSSHGEKGHVLASDGQFISIIDEIVKPFYEDSCKSLANKPKFFIFQACQMDPIARTDSTVQSDTSGGEWDLSKALAELNERDVKDLERRIQNIITSDSSQPRKQTVDHAELTPRGKDILIGYSCLPGSKSWRIPSSGSIYVQKLCNQAKKQSSEDIDSILKNVARDVEKALEEIRKTVNDMTGSGRKVEKDQKQIPFITSSLMKKFYLEGEPQGGGTVTLGAAEGGLKVLAGGLPCADLKVGDLIVAINGKDIENLDDGEDHSHVLKTASSNGSLDITVHRGDWQWTALLAGVRV